MNNKPLVHAALSNLPVEGDCLVVGGIPLSRLAQRVGGTPFYAYERQCLTERVQRLRTVLPGEIALHYSVKANPMPAVVQHLAGLVDGFDVASAGELAIALDTPLPPVSISFSGPGKQEYELSRTIAAGCLIHLESVQELDTVARLGDRLGITPNVMIRVNPDFDVKSSGMRMGGGAKPFGIDAEEVPGVLTRIARMGLGFHGFHVYSGSQNLQAETLIEEKARIFELALRLSRKSPMPIPAVNIGGGFGIPYFLNDTALEIGRIGEALHTLMQGLQSELPGIRVILELGRYIVGEAGIYVVRVIDRKISRGQVFLVTDGGLHHHLAASGNFGQVIRRNYPMVVGTRMATAARERVTIVGPLCTPLDLLGDRIEMAPAEVGDLIVIFQSGAYGLTASPTAFLGHPKPHEVLV